MGIGKVSSWLIIFPVNAVQVVVQSPKWKVVAVVFSASPIDSAAASSIRSRLPRPSRLTLDKSHWH